jgi:hypothetical protein
MLRPHQWTRSACSDICKSGVRCRRYLRNRPLADLGYAQQSLRCGRQTGHSLHGQNLGCGELVVSGQSTNSLQLRQSQLCLVNRPNGIRSF